MCFLVIQKLKFIVLKTQLFVFFFFLTLYSSALKDCFSAYRNVLVKGGDLPDSLDAVDIFFDGEHRPLEINQQLSWYFFIYLMYECSVHSKGNSVLRTGTLQVRTYMSCALHA